MNIKLNHLSGNFVCNSFKIVLRSVVFLFLSCFRCLSPRSLSDKMKFAMALTLLLPIDFVAAMVRIKTITTVTFLWKWINPFPIQCSCSCPEPEYREMAEPRTRTGMRGLRWGPQDPRLQGPSRGRFSHSDSIIPKVDAIKDWINKHLNFLYLLGRWLKIYSVQPTIFYFGR